MRQKKSTVFFNFSVYGVKYPFLIKTPERRDEQPSRAIPRHSVKDGPVRNGVIICSDLLMQYLQKNYPGFYYVSSTTKVLTEFSQFEDELNRGDFLYVAE